MRINEREKTPSSGIARKLQRYSSATFGLVKLFPVICAFIMAIPVASLAQAPAKVDETVLKNLQWRSLGPAIMGGRIDDFAVVESNPNIFYVAVAGHLWGPNKERGVYKTTDGGKTWTNVLFINEDTGVIDLAMDPQSPMTLYAAAYQRRRTPFGFNGGGPGSAIYRTVDGGATWKKLTADLPEGPTGRIGIDIYRGNPNIVYAIIENDGVNDV